MNRVRIVNGTLDDLLRRSDAELDELVPAAMSREEAAVIARKAMSKEATLVGSLGDPAGMLSDGLGRFEEVPAGRMTDRAKDLCQNHQAEDGRFTVAGMPDHDIVIVAHPKREKVQGVDGTMIEVDHYVVFAREIGGNGEPTMVTGNCYRCNYAEERGWTVKPHDCWRKKRFSNWVPVLFAKAHGYDDAEDLAKELRSAWSATTEQEEMGWDEHGYPFTGEWMDGYLAAKPNAWTSTSSTEDPSRGYEG